tara:strand:+ start:428 stop:1030 length:603 start_codon:yes stop_codon:yes gene_type:complete
MTGVKFIPFFLFTLLLTLCHPSYAQDSIRIDTTETSKVIRKSEAQKEHSPTKAAILSAVLPGAGQVYNKKYWKLPIIYAAFGSCIYFAIDNHKQYVRYRDAYRAETDDDSTTVSEFANYAITTEGIKDWRDQYKEWMELSYILGGVTYVLQIIDASVDAHLMYFDVSDDLSIHWQPEFRRIGNTNQTYAGFRLNFTLKYK